jgi:hypothetical protein
MTPPIEAGGNDLRAYWACNYLADTYGLHAVPAHDETGQPTGCIALNPDDLSEWLSTHTEPDEEEN